MATTFHPSRTLGTAAKRRLAHVDGVRPGVTASGYERSLRPCEARFSRPESTIWLKGGC
jgi:hypothetical protein